MLLRKFASVPAACELFDVSWRVAQLIPDVAQPANDDDRRLVGAAAAARADLFVTGDKRILGWQRVVGPAGVLRIVAPREAWGLITRDPSDY